MSARHFKSMNTVANGGAESKREPFCWLEKHKLRFLSEVFGEGNYGSLSAARSVMLALSEIASDKQSDTFTVSTSYIAQRAGVTSKTVRRMNTTFRKLGFVTIRCRSASGLKLSHQYTLIRGKCPLRVIYPTMRKPRKVRLRTREESGEESTEGTARTGEHSSVILTRKNDKSAGDGDVVIHSQTGERFNKRTKEFEW